MSRDDRAKKTKTAYTALSVVLVLLFAALLLVFLHERQKAGAEQKAVPAIASAAVSESTAETASSPSPSLSPKAKRLDGLKSELDTYVASLDGKWCILAEDLGSGEQVCCTKGVAENDPMVSASLIKLYIMGAVYERVEDGTIAEASVSETLKKMITFSDNSAANQLVKLLGDGDEAKGMDAINAFARKLGCPNTRMNRLMLVKNDKQNYTTAADCAVLLKKVYAGTLVSKGSSEKMLALLKAQTVRTKIPAGLPAGIVCANKTGELTGKSECDAAIVFTPERDYILCGMSEPVENPAAIKAIKEISAKTYDAMTKNASVSPATAVKTGKTVVIDPGHQSKADLRQEPIGPGAKQTKYSVSGGAQGISTRQTEYALNLAVSEKLKAALEKRGYTVIMTRESNDVDITNSERAKIANDAGADAFVRIHANGSNSSSDAGAMTLCQTANNPYCGAYYADSRRLSDCVLDGLLAETGAKCRGVQETDDMTGNNWSKVPVTIVETGFLSNPDEDAKLATDTYQNRLAVGIADGIDSFFA